MMYFIKSSAALCSFKTNLIVTRFIRDVKVATEMMLENLQVIYNLPKVLKVVQSRRNFYCVQGEQRSIIRESLVSRLRERVMSFCAFFISPYNL